MKSMTPGEMAVWAARFNQAQLDYFQGAHEERSMDSGAVLTPEDATAILMSTMSAAAEQAASVVITLRAMEPPAGSAGELLRQIRGEPTIPLPAPLPTLQEPFDRSLPPPGWMVLAGRTDVCMPVAGGDQVDLDVAWRRHEVEHDPPAYQVEAVSLVHSPAAVHVVARICPDILLRSKIVNPDDTQEIQAARAFCWRCFTRPHHVSFWARFGHRINLLLTDILTWTDQQLLESWNYLQARAAWQAAQPEQPGFWTITSG